MPEAARETLEMEGTVREALPNALYRVELLDEQRTAITAHGAARACSASARGTWCWCSSSPTTRDAGES